MVMRGETILTGAPDVCPECYISVKPFKVLRSNAGYYIGTTCNCGNYTRESGYYLTREDAEFSLKNNTFGR